MPKYRLALSIWKTNKLISLVVIMTFSIGMSYAAEPVKPPIEGSLKERFAIITAIPLPNGTFKIKESLWDPKKQFTSKQDVEITNFSHLYSDIQAINKQQPNCHIFVVSKFRKHLLYREVIEDNPKGVEIQTLPAVGPGIFSCNDDLIKIYSNIIDEKSDHEPQYLTTLLKLLESDDLQTRRLAAFELSMHRDWVRLADEKHTNSLRKQLNNQSIPDELTEMLIQAATGLPEDKYNNWFKAYLINNIKNNPSPYDLVTYTPLLVRSSVKTLYDLSLLTEDDWSSIEPLLFSNAPGVAKAAIRTLEKLNTDRLHKETEAIFAANDKVDKLHTETQRVLKAFLQRSS